MNENGDEVLVGLVNAVTVWRPYSEINNFTVGWFLTGVADDSNADDDGNPELMAAYAVSQSFQFNGKLYRNDVKYEEHKIKGKMRVVAVQASKPKRNSLKK